MRSLEEGGLCTTELSCKHERQWWKDCDRKLIVHADWKLPIGWNLTISINWFFYPKLIIAEQNTKTMYCSKSRTKHNMWPLPNLCFTLYEVLHSLYKTKKWSLWNSPWCPCTLAHLQVNNVLYFSVCFWVDKCIHVLVSAKMAPCPLHDWLTHFWLLFYVF